MVQKIAAALFRPPTACVHCLLKEENFLESYCELFAFSPLAASSLKIAGARCCKWRRHAAGSVGPASLVRSIYLEDIFDFGFVFVFVFVIVSVYVYMSLLDTQREALKQPTWLDPFF